MIETSAHIAAPLRLAVVGLGRMGMVHAHHVIELSRETQTCELVAVSTIDPRQAKALFAQTGASVPVFTTIEDLAQADICDAAILVTNTSLHQQHTTLMLEAGKRVFLEKPLTGALATDREFAASLEQRYPDDVMLGFQRRFDEPLVFAKTLLDDGAIGRLFRIYSALEDSAPAPDGFNSPGLLSDMAIHNVDEVLWLTQRMPSGALVVGSNVHSNRLTTCNEDFDDALLLLDFGSDNGMGLTAEIQVSRNHVSGYHAETILYGESGQIRVGRFDGNPREILVEAYGLRGSKPFAIRSFPTREYDASLPEFVHRFGAAYKEELCVFIDCCRSEAPFPVTHRDALCAQEVIDAAMTRVLSSKDMAPIRAIGIS